MNYLFIQSNFSVSSSGVEGGGTSNVVWEYSNGTASSDWKTLSLTTNGCGNFTATGNCTNSWNIPSDWVQQNVNGTTKYWIRVNGTGNYSAKPTLAQISVIEYNLNMTVQDELGNALTGASFATNGTGGVFSSREIGSGVYELALYTGEVHNLTVSKSGYINQSNVTTSALNTTLTQWHPSHMLPFGLKVISKDELGNNLTPTTFTFRGNSAIANVSDTVFYYNDTGGSNGVLYLYKSGYVTSNATNAALNNITTGPGAQVVITLGNYSADNSGSITTSKAVKGLEHNIKITVKDELGNLITGATVTIQNPTEGIKFTATDGGSKDNSTTDGVIYWAKTPLAGDVNITNLSVYKNGYTNWDNTTQINLSAYQYLSQVAMNSSNNYTFKLIASTELNKNITLTVNVTDDDGISTTSYSNVTKNSTASIYYFALNTTYDSINLTMNSTGFITQVDNNSGSNYAISPTYQRTLSKSFLYTVKVKVMDELNNTRNVTINEINNATSVVQNTSETGVYFLKATHGNVINVNISKLGYITRNVTIGVSNESFGASQLTYTFSSSQTPLQYGFKVIGVYDELGQRWTNLGDNMSTGVLTVANSTMSVVEQYNGSGPFIWVAANGSNLNFTMQRSGYINNTISGVSYDSSAQKTIIFNQSGADYNASNGMQFNLKIILKDELGNNITGTINVTNGTGESAQKQFTNRTGSVYYFALNISNYTDVNITANKTGFVNATSGATTYSISETVQRSIVWNMSYTVKINASNELGDRLTLNSTTTTFSGLVNVSAIRYSDGYAYIPANPANQSTLYTLVTGYVNTSTTGQVNVTDGSQILVNYSGASASGQNGIGLKFILKISVTTSGGSNITDASITIAKGGVDSVASYTNRSGGTYYYAINSSKYDTVNITVAKTGYESGHELNSALSTASQTVLSFSLNGDINAPGVPILSLPKNTTTVTDTTPLLEWTAPTDIGAGVKYYELQVSNISATNFSTLIVNQTTLTTAGYTIPSGTLTSGQTYYWRVRAIDDANNTGSWSSVLQFIYFTGNYTQKFDYVGWHVWQFLPKTVVENNLTSLSSNYNVSNVLSSISSKYTVLYHYDDSNSAWTSYVPGRDVNDLTEMNQTSPWYVIHMNATGTLRIA